MCIKEGLEQPGKRCGPEDLCWLSPTDGINLTMQPALKDLAPGCTYREPIIHSKMQQKLSTVYSVSHNSGSERRRLEQRWKKKTDRHWLAMRSRLSSTKSPQVKVEIPNSELCVPIWHNLCSASHLPTNAIASTQHPGV